MKKAILILTAIVTFASCTKEDIEPNNLRANLNEKFEITSYKTQWTPSQFYAARISYNYTIDTVGVDFVEITNSLRQGQGYSFRHFKTPPTLTANNVVDLAACDNCKTIYTCTIIYRNRTRRQIAELTIQ